MHKTTLLTVSILAVASFIAFAADSSKHNIKPKDGYVPNSKTAIKIAVAVWGPIYGEDKIAGEAPYQAHLTNGVWVVTGSLPKGQIGGVAVAEIAKDDGKIVRVSHGK